MNKEFLKQIMTRKAFLETELKVLADLLAVYEVEEILKEKPKGKRRRGTHVSLPSGQKCETVINIAKELHASVQRPVTIEEISSELHNRGFRIPRNKQGGSLMSAYLNAGKKLRREGDGYVPAVA